MATLTKKEKAWLDKVQKVLDECPSERIGFFTIGDPTINAFDVTKFDEIQNHLSNNNGGDFCKSVMVMDADFGEELNFNNPVESTAG